MKHLKLFQADADYQSFVSNVKTPNVSFVENDIKVYYNPSVEEKPIEIVLPEMATAGYNPDLVLYYGYEDTVSAYEPELSYVNDELYSYFTSIYKINEEEEKLSYTIVYPNTFSYGVFDWDKMIYPEGKLFTTPTLFVTKYNWKTGEHNVLLEKDISNYPVYQNYLSKLTLNGHSNLHNYTMNKESIREMFWSYGSVVMLQDFLPPFGPCYPAFGFSREMLLHELD